MTERSRRRSGGFIATREHRRFVEFANAVRSHRYIGLCYGPAGVGKTLSARRYANWDLAEPLLNSWGPDDASDHKVHAALARSRTLFFTPSVSGTLNEAQQEFKWLSGKINDSIDRHVNPGVRIHDRRKPLLERIELVIVDEAERLKYAAIEHLRDVFDRNDVGLIFIGMPGIEKRMSYFPQLYSRVGFAHQYPPLQRDEVIFVLQRHCKKFGVTLEGRRLYRCSGRHRHRSHYRRQLPPAPQTAGSGRTRPAHQRACRPLRRRRRSGERNPDHR